MNELLQKRRDEGQGLVEYALLLMLVAVVIIAILTILGPQVGEVFSRVSSSLGGGGGGIASVTATRSNGGHGDNVSVTVTVNSPTTITAVDSQSNHTAGPVNCATTCTLTVSHVGHHAGTITVTSSDGGSSSAGYGPRIDD